MGWMMVETKCYLYYQRSMTRHETRLWEEANMKTQRRHVISVIALTVIGMVFTFTLSCSRKTPQEDYNIRVGYKANSGYQVLFVAEAKALFAKHGVQVEKQEFESTELMLQAIALGQIDATPAGNLETIAKIDKESPGPGSKTLNLG